MLFVSLWNRIYPYRDLQRCLQKFRSWFPSGGGEEAFTEILKKEIGSESKPQESQRKLDTSPKFVGQGLRIAIGGFGAESNSLNLEMTGNDSVEIIESDSMLISQREKPTVLGGFINALSTAGIEIVPLFRAFWTDGRVVQEKSYQRFKAQFLDLVSQAGRLDGILLDLHGAMVTEQLEDPEGELLKDLRECVGAELPIVCVLDMHANLTNLKVKSMNALVGYKTNPHIDLFGSGHRAAEILLATIRGEVKPKIVLRRIPMFGHNLGMSTWSYKNTREQLPFSKVLSQLRSLVESSQKCIVDASVFIGFPQADVSESTISVSITTSMNTETALASAEEIAALIWNLRYEFLKVRPLIPVEQAVRRVYWKQEHARCSR